MSQIDPQVLPACNAFRQDYLAVKQQIQRSIVGHEPTLGRLAQALLGSTQPCSLKKGATLCLELAPDRPKLSGTLQ